MPSPALALLVALAAATGPAVGVAGREPPAPAGVRVETDGAPPSPLSDPRRAPTPGEAWIDGHWQWSGGRWAWVAGQWAVPPAPGATWVPARWIADDRGFTFHEPFWRLPSRPDVAFQPTPVPHPFAKAVPPALLVEVRGPAPARDSTFIPGFWTWTGSRWAWVAGTWSAPVAGASWVEGSWRRESGGFRWVPGRWRRN